MKFWKNLSLRTKWISVVILVLIILVGSYWWSNRSNGTAQAVAVTRGDVVQKVLVSGKIEATQKAELSFEAGGAVRQIARQAGELVKAGELIASLDLSELSVQLARQQAALEKTQLALATLLDPPEVVDKLAAQNTLGQSQEALTKAQVDSANAISTALVDLPTVLNKLDDLATAGSGYLSDNNVRLVGDRALDYKNKVEASYWLAQKSYDVVKKNPDLDSVYQTTKLVATAIKDLYGLVVYLEDQSNNPDSSIATDKATLSTYTTTINTDLADLLAGINDVEKTTRDVVESQAKLSDLLDGATANDVATQRLAVRQAELDVQDTRVQMAKRQVRAPFDGVVARNDLDLGETVVANTALVSVISENQYQVVAKVPEAEVTKIAIGNQAIVTLDAYPASELQLTAQVISVDPAEVVVDGVATYKVTLQFANQDSKIKSGMTASLEITGASKFGVITVSERALNLKDGNYVVRVVENDDLSNLAERLVSVGLRGSDGKVEILSGLREGEQVAVGVVQ